MTSNLCTGKEAKDAQPEGEGSQAEADAAAAMDVEDVNEGEPPPMMSQEAWATGISLDNVQEGQWCECVDGSTGGKPGSLP